MYKATFINALKQFGKLNFDLIIEDQDGVMPSLRYPVQFDDSATQDDLTAFASAEIVKAQDAYDISQIVPDPITDVPNERQLTLWGWENAYIAFCQSLGFPTKATTGQLETFCQTMITEGQSTGDMSKVITGITIGVKALAIMNAITQNGGNWDHISYHEGLE